MIKTYNNKADYEAAAKSVTESDVSLIGDVNDAVVDGVNVIVENPTFGDAVYLDENDDVKYVKGGDWLNVDKIPKEWESVGVVVENRGKEGVLVVHKKSPVLKLEETLRYVVTGQQLDGEKHSVTMRVLYESTVTQITFEYSATSDEQLAEQITKVLEANNNTSQVWWAHVAKNCIGEKCLMIQCDTYSNYKQTEWHSKGLTLEIDTMRPGVWSEVRKGCNSSGARIAGNLHLGRYNEAALEAIIDYLRRAKTTPSRNVTVKGEGLCSEEAWNDLSNHYLDDCRAAFPSYRDFVQSRGLVFNGNNALMAYKEEGVEKRLGNYTVVKKSGQEIIAFPTFNSCLEIDYNHDGLRRGDWYMGRVRDVVLLISRITYGAPGINSQNCDTLNKTLKKINNIYYSLNDFYTTCNRCSNYDIWGFYNVGFNTMNKSFSEKKHLAFALLKSKN